MAQRKILNNVPFGDNRAAMNTNFAELYQDVGEAQQAANAAEEAANAAADIAAAATLAAESAQLDAGQLNAIEEAKNLVSDGDGTKFLSDDGRYKTIAGGGIEEAPDDGETDTSTLMSRRPTAPNGNIVVFDGGDSADGGKSIDEIINICREHADSLRFSVDTPDYSNMETINRISTNNGTWTADRNGFVFCSLSRTNGPFIAYVNDKEICRQGSVATVVITNTVILSVAKNDVIKLSATSGFSSCACYYIPSLKIHAPIINYSVGEVDTGIKWIDGSPIYSKVLKGITAETTNTPKVIGNISNLGEMVSVDGSVLSSNDYHVPLFYTNTIDSACITIIVTNTGDTEINIINSPTLYNRPITAVIKYTKTI